MLCTEVLPKLRLADVQSLMHTNRALRSAVVASKAAKQLALVSDTTRSCRPSLPCDSLFTCYTCVQGLMPADYLKRQAPQGTWLQQLNALAGLHVRIRSGQPAGVRALHVQANDRPADAMNSQVRLSALLQNSLDSAVQQLYTLSQDWVETSFAQPLPSVARQTESARQAVMHDTSSQWRVCSSRQRAPALSSSGAALRSHEALSWFGLRLMAASPGASRCRSVLRDVVVPPSLSLFLRVPASCAPRGLHRSDQSGPRLFIIGPIPSVQ